MTDDLYSLSYFSRNAIATKGTAALSGEIEEILKTARASNAQRGVTGALLYSAGCFAQVLEGPLAEVETIFERIQLDPRHRDVRVLQFHPVERRSFAQWSMAFAGIDPDAPERAKIDAALSDPGKIDAGPEGLDLVAILHDLIARHDLHKV
jgi:hypothetical protein